ncbi:MAG TPA: hypothetical protein VH206_12825 [Xanthobacteraceae bacterium]|jgi:hypothetical protein|nr:hypothetical protein [Xanthobacteraceae bacterium]
MANASNSTAAHEPFSASNTAVMLPCEPDQFRNFIAGLLGRPQTITKNISGQYELKRIDIENLYHLLDQRISTQNGGTLVQFSVRIFYNDKSAVLLNSFDDFISYNEVKPLVSIGVILSWTFLIQFNNKKFPEKQQIDINFFTRRGEEEFLMMHRGLVFPPPPLQSGSIQFRIAHTDRSWGTDLQALLVGQLELLLQHSPPLRRFVRDYSGTIGLLSAITLGGSLTNAAWRIIGHFREQALSEFKNAALSNPSTLPELAKISKTTLQLLISNPADFYLGALFCFIFVSAIGSIVFGVVVATFAEAQKPSFILLTAKAEERRNAILRKDKNNWFKLILSIFGALVLSVIGNAIFYYILKTYFEAPQ